MEVFLNKVIHNNISNKAKLDDMFNILIDNFEKNYSRSNELILLNILDDYYFSIDKLNNKDTTTSNRKFSFFIYSQLMAKIKSIGILKSSLDKNNFSKYRYYLIKEVELSNVHVSCSFSNILSNSSIINTSKESLNYLNNFWANYLEIFVNLHQYTDTNIKTNIRIAESFLQDFINENSGTKAIESVNNINKWLKEIVEWCSVK